MLVAILLFAFFVVAGALVRSAWLFLAILVIPASYLGIYFGWWGYGLGESWQLAMLFATVLGGAIISAGILTGSWIRDSFGNPGSRRSRG